MTSNIAQVLAADQKDDPIAQSVRIGGAYAALFSGRGGRDDADLVLVDLAQFTRYYDTAMIGLSPEEALAGAQRRAVFQRIMDALALTGNEPSGLLTAVITAPEPDATEESAQ